MSQLKVLYALCMRDQKEIISDLGNSLINAAILVFFEGIQFLYLYPALGMPPDIAAAIFIGTYVIVLIMVGFAKALTLAYDLRFNRCIDYTIMLPVSPLIICIRHIISTVVTMVCNSFPLFLIAKIMLASSPVQISLYWQGFVGMYLLSMVFFAILFHIVAFTASFDWFLYSLWDQLILPLEIFGGVFFTWASVQKTFPLLSSIMLFNPITYIVEGLRLSLFDGPMTFTLTRCMITILASIVVGLFFLSRQLKKRLDLI